ncbi:hypothetical protein SCAR479_03513 [Seiridium cardinale]|uniref:Uncharacterized protein n=1 Tax=Seiridium cardinale TaxID=138064 RepID=A0ABR2Y061_9PEZI
MAPVPIEHAPSYVPLALSTTHLGLVVYLTYAVGASLFTSYKSLTPSQDTRQRREWRRTLVPVFAGLAAVALVSASYSSLTYAVLSYKVWAHERGIELPQRIVGDKGFLPGTHNSSQVYLAQWLNDTPVYYDAFEIIAEKARRFWWGQQIDLGTVSWSLLLAIEGRRRRIPLLTAFLALAHLVNLSFAQNLFYLALLLTPAPIAAGQDELELPIVPIPTSRLARIRNAISPPKPTNWCPHPTLFLGAALINFASLFALPYAADTPSFITVTLVTRLSTLLPLIIPKIVPVSWGTVHPHPHNAYSSFTTLFRVIAFTSFALHAKATFLGLRYNLPDSHYHRHSRFLPWDIEERSTWEQSTTAIGKVLGSTSDHPVVAAVGWDVLLCALSLGFWTAIRATDVEGIITSTVPFYRKSAYKNADHEAKDTPRPTIKEESEAAESSEPEAGTSMTLRRRGHHKSRVASIASIASSDAGTDEASSGTVRRRGRPKRKVAEDEKAYEPTAQEARQVVEGDVLPPEQLDWESAALAWGLAAFGGLGASEAGVFGAECVARIRDHHHHAMLLHIMAFIAGAAAQGFPSTCPAVPTYNPNATLGVCPTDFTIIGPELEPIHESKTAPTGLAVDCELNVYLTYPRNTGATPINVAKATNFTSEEPWPNAAIQNCTVSQDPAECFINVQNVVLDALGQLWVVDSGIPPGAKSAISRGAKIIAFSQAGETLRTYIIPDEFYYDSMNSNDVRINNTLGSGGYAFITDESNSGSLLAINLDDGSVTRRLYNTTVTKSDTKYVGSYNGEPIYIWNNTKKSYATTGADGIALASGNVYWGVLASRRFYFISQETLIDTTLSDEEMLAAVQDPGELGSEQAGFTADDHGRVYMLASEQNAIYYVDTQQSEVAEEVNETPPGGTGPVPTENYVVKTLVRSGLIQHADSAAILDGWLYFCTNQLELSPLRQYKNVDARKAPLVWLHSEDPFRPSDILRHVQHTTPMVNMEPIAGLPELDLDNLALLNEHLDSGPVSLTANDDITDLPAWLFGETPDESGRLHNSTPCVVILVPYGDGSNDIDAFYFYFYSFDRGANISQVLPPLNGMVEDSGGQHFGNHVGDCEHVDGSAYYWDDAALSMKNERPLVYSAYGSHANWLTIRDHRDHVHDEVLIDYCDAGQLWDPVSSAYYYHYDRVTSQLTRIFLSGASETSNSTSFLYYTGIWGDFQYPDDDPRQKTVPRFGLKRYVSGPTGPITKQLVRKGLSPDHREKKSWLQWGVGIFMSLYPCCFRGWRAWVSGIVFVGIMVLMVLGIRYAVKRYRSRVKGYKKVDTGTDIPLDNLDYRDEIPIDHAGANHQ